jgi:hypothetical protein
MSFHRESRLSQKKQNRHNEACLPAGRASYAMTASINVLLRHPLSFEIKIHTCDGNKTIVI